MTARVTMIDRTCACCGRAFKARLADFRRGWARYCSKPCKGRGPCANRVAAAVTPPKPRQSHIEHVGRAGAGSLGDIEVWGPMQTTGPEFQFADGVRS